MEQLSSAFWSHAQAQVEHAAEVALRESERRSTALAEAARAAEAHAASQRAQAQQHASRLEAEIRVLSAQVKERDEEVRACDGRRPAPPRPPAPSHPKGHPRRVSCTRRGWRVP